MSELINATRTGKDFRLRLLTSVSVLAFIGSVCSADAADEDSDRPTVWIELGGQLSQLADSHDAFAPAIFAGRPSMFSPPGNFEKPPSASFDEEGKISFQPDGSNWVFSAAIRYGRSSSKHSVHQQTYPAPFVLHYNTPGAGVLGTWPPYGEKFADTDAQFSERHMIVDFQVGKDVGLGMFANKDATSVFSIGVRFAQFSATSNIALKSDPDWHFIYTYLPFLANYFTQTKFPIQQPFHSNLASMRASRSFHGIGPSISWNASTPVMGSAQSGELGIDWGVNAALLFGRQKAQTHHQTTARYNSGYFQPKFVTLYRLPATPDHTRSKSVMVPNIGGFAGLSFKFPNAKLSLGYRADFFFGAMDGGIEAAKKEDRNFSGPFAAVSIGLGG
jgi:hypothetical protein